MTKGKRYTSEFKAKEADAYRTWCGEKSITLGVASIEKIFTIVQELLNAAEEAFAGKALTWPSAGKFSD